MVPTYGRVQHTYFPAHRIRQSTTKRHLSNVENAWPNMPHLHSLHHSLHATTTHPPTHPPTHSLSSLNYFRPCQASTRAAQVRGQARWWLRAASSPVACSSRGWMTARGCLQQIASRCMVESPDTPRYAGPRAPSPMLCQPPCDDTASDIMPSQVITTYWGVCNICDSVQGGSWCR